MSRGVKQTMTTYQRAEQPQPSSEGQTKFAQLITRGVRFGAIRFPKTSRVKRPIATFGVFFLFYVLVLYSFQRLSKRTRQVIGVDIVTDPTLSTLQSVPSTLSAVPPLPPQKGTGNWPPSRPWSISLRMASPDQQQHFWVSGKRRSSPTRRYCRGLNLGPRGRKVQGALLPSEMPPARQQTQGPSWLWQCHLPQFSSTFPGPHLFPAAMLLFQLLLLPLGFSGAETEAAGVTDRGEKTLTVSDHRRKTQRPHLLSSACCRC